MKLIVNGEGHTVLTDEESRAIRFILDSAEPRSTAAVSVRARMAWQNGIQRATERMQAEAKAGRKK